MIWLITCSAPKILNLCHVPRGGQVEVRLESCPMLGTKCHERSSNVHSCKPRWRLIKPLSYPKMTDHTKCSCSCRVNGNSISWGIWDKLLTCTLNFIWIPKYETDQEETSLVPSRFLYALSGWPPAVGSPSSVMVLKPTCVIGLNTMGYRLTTLQPLHWKVHAMLTEIHSPGTVILCNFIFT